jgi:HD-GYP domain-containing protein (c-di-GMP phosphodiesterase class II)
VSSDEQHPQASSAEARAFLGLARKVIQQVAVLIRNAYLHEPTNEVFREPTERLQAIVRTVLGHEGSLTLEVVGSEIYANNTRVRVEIRSLHTYKYFISELAERGLGGLRIDAEPRTASIATFLSLLGRLRRGAEEPNVEALNQALQGAGVHEISAVPKRLQVERPPVDRRQRAIATYQQALDFIRHCMTSLDSPAQVNLRQAKRIVHNLVDLSYEEGDGFSMIGLAAIKSHDEYTFNHMVNVCVLAVAFGQRLGLSRQQLAQLGLCALYHDLGKLKIPLEVLNKHGTLTEQEWALMGNHTVFGAREIFSMIASDRQAVLRVLGALQHHMGHDGKGYPKAVLRTRPNLFASIVSIVDTFDAMTTKRVYQKQFLPDEALAVLQKGSGAKYDPLLVKAFISCVGIYPAGSTVLLDTGELAVVCEPCPDPAGLHRPKIKLVTDAQARPREPELVDLAAPEHQGRTVLRCVDPELFGINAPHFAI